MQYPPETIAVSCIWLASQVLQIHLPEEPKPWWELFEYISIDQIEDISSTILSLYKRENPKYIGLDELREIISKRESNEDGNSNTIDNNNYDPLPPLPPSSMNGQSGKVLLYIM